MASFPMPAKLQHELSRKMQKAVFPIQLRPPLFVGGTSITLQ
jgi:hypothetical protein